MLIHLCLRKRGRVFKSQLGVVALNVLLSFDLILNQYNEMNM
jgi:hypothetical protein